MLHKTQEPENASTGRFSNPVFVVGFYRSGTSLLYALLNQHPQMALMFECNVWDFPEVFSRWRFKNDWLRRLEFYNQTLSRHRLIFAGSQRGLENTRTPDDLYHTFMEVKGGVLWGEKSPAYSVRLRQLVKQYPNCAFILLWRDPVEICRSIIRAGPKDPFLQRRGMLSRLIYYQEQMIQQTNELDRAGVRVCHVTYDNLIDDTGKICRRICDFLGIEFDEKMLDVANADLFALGPGPEHDHLRRGKIERQRFSGQPEVIPPLVLERLQRFNVRWRRLQSQWLGGQTDAPVGPEPSAVECLSFKISGAFFRAVDDGKRVLFEFLPLAWLRTYRQTKSWLKGQRVKSPADQRSFGERFKSHWITILTSATAMAVVAFLDLVTGPDVTLLPFYLIPCAVLTLVVSGRWGTFAAAVAIVIWSAIQTHQNPDLYLQHWPLLLWNAVMRFVLLQIIVLLLSRVRSQSELVEEKV